MTNVIEKTVQTKGEMEALYNKSALTFEGIGRDNTNVSFIKDWLKQHGALINNKDLVIWWCTGEFMNYYSDLRGDNAYPDDLNIMIVDSDTIEMGKIIMARFELRGRWLDDVIDNNERRESVWFSFLFKKQFTNSITHDIMYI